MKKTILLSLCLVILAACAPAPVAKEQQQSAEPTLTQIAVQPTPMIESTDSGIIVRGPKVVEGKKIHAISIENGKGRSQYATRTDEKLSLELGVGDVVRLAVPYGEPEVTLTGAIRQQLKPGDTIYVELTKPGSSAIIIAVGQTQTDLLEVVASSPEAEKAVTVQVEPPKPRPIKAFDISAKNWVFDPAIIEVQQGDLVVLSVTSLDDEHGIGIAEYDINMKLPAGRTQNASFIADKKGQFPFYCNIYCGSGHKSMRGMLIVK